MKIVVAPDKFKGSLPAAQVAAAVAAGLRSGLARAGCPAAELVTIPVADGGEGTVDAAVAAGFERVPVTAAGPTGDPVRSGYARRGEVAVVELADVCGLARLPGGRPAPLTASSFGAGEVLRAALESGARRIVLGVGGSASTDGGAGLLQALGARVLGASGELAAPMGGGALGDVAALDTQSLAGKTPVGVARAAGRHGIDVVAVAGRSTLTPAELAAAGIAAAYPLSDLEPDLERCRAEAARLLSHTGQMIAQDRLAGVAAGA